MNIKVHTTLVLAACTITGLARGGVVTERSRRIDSGRRDVGATSVTLRNAELLEQSVGEWLIVNDLVLIQDESLMLTAAKNGASRLRIEMARLAEEDLVVEQRQRLGEMRGLIDEIESVVFESRDHHGQDRPERLSELTARSAPLSDELVIEVAALNRALQTRAEHLHVDLTEQREFLAILAWLAAAVYFGIVWLCWLWTAHRIVAPIESLSAAAERADHEEREFELPKTGPEEVQLLTQNISNFVSKLQAAKASTEEQVRQRTVELVKANQA